LTRLIEQWSADIVRLRHDQRPGADEALQTLMTWKREAGEEMRELISSVSPVSEDAARVKCPECGGRIASNVYYTPRKGYCIVWECEGTIAEPRTCSYRRVL
jgi:hypothetical protein